MSNKTNDLVSAATNDELPIGWTTCRLGEALTLVNGRAYSQHEMLSEGTPILRIQNLNKGKNWFYSNLNLPPDKYCNEGDLLYAWSATFGPYWWHGPKAIFHYHIWNVFPSDLMSKEFAFYELMRITDAIKRAAHGVAMPHITKGGMEAWEIMLPPPAEQKRIADKLAAVQRRVDTCRARLNLVPGLLKRFRQSVLAAATSGQLTEDWREENKATCETPPHEVVADDLEELPSGWFWSCPEKIKKDERYALAIGPFGSNLKVSDYRESGVPLVFVREIRSRSFGSSNTKFVTREKAEELKAHSVSGGDLLMTKMGDPPGDVAVYPTHAPKAIITADCIKLRVDPAKAETTFVSYVIESPQARARLLDIVAGVAQQKISLERFRDFPLQIAPLPEQAEIVRRVEALFAMADRIEARLTAARAQVERLTPATLSKAFRGDLVPQDPNDEPASKLLERLNKDCSNAAQPRTKARKAKTTA